MAIRIEPNPYPSRLDQPPPVAERTETAPPLELTPPPMAPATPSQGGALFKAAENENEPSLNWGVDSDGTPRAEATLEDTSAADRSAPLRRASAAPGLNAGQLGHLNTVIDAVNESGLEGDGALRAMVVLAAAAQENGFSNLTGAPEQLRDGTTGLINLPAENSMGDWSVAERNDVPSALGRLLDLDAEGSLAQLLADPEKGLGDVASALDIAGTQRSKMTESVDFLAEAGVLSPEAAERMRGVVAADESLSEQTWDMASFSGDNRSYDFWADEYQPSPGKRFNATRRRSWGIGYHNGLDLMGGNRDVYSAFGNGEVTSLTAWGSGAWDPGSNSSSNAIRVGYDIPGQAGQFYVDYGHIQINDTLDVKVGDTVAAGQDIGRTSFDDSWSQGGHLDVKIRIPSALASAFAAHETRATSDDLVFVDVQPFMQWYREQAGAQN